MGRNAMITEKQVHDAADRLAASGTKPNTSNLQMQFGVGSKTTYSRHLRSWEDKQPKPESAFSVLPPAIIQTLTNFVAEEITTANANLAANAASLRQENLDLIEHAETQNAAIEALETELQVANQGKAELTGRVVELINSLTVAESKIETYRGLAESSQISLAQAKVHAERLPKLESDLELARIAKSEAVINEAIAAERLQKMEAKVQELQGQLLSIEQEVRELRSNNFATQVPNEPRRVPKPVEPSVSESTSQDRALMIERTTQANETNRKNRNKSGR